MLILFRKVGQTIVIGGLIKVTVTEVRDEGVRLGILAPKEVTVHREEVQARIDAGEPSRR